MDARNIGIVDYGSGNFASVQNAVRYLGFPTTRVHAPRAISGCSHLILPGVGAFDAAVHKLRQLQLFEAIRSVGTARIPFLGICIGMQLLADWGTEGGKTEGLGLIPGGVIKLNILGDLRLPHIGWNEITVMGDGNPLLEGLEERAAFYFVHSFAFAADREENVLARATYGESFTAIVQRDKIYGVQFHPEKSQKPGLQLLKNFCELT